MQARHRLRHETEIRSERCCYHEPLCRATDLLVGGIWFAVAYGARKFSQSSSSSTEEWTLPAVCGTSCFRRSQGQLTFAILISGERRDPSRSFLCQGEYLKRRYVYVSQISFFFSLQVCTRILMLEATELVRLA